MLETKIEIISQTNFDDQTKPILEQAVILLQDILNRAEFRNKVLATDFSEKKGLSNQQILDKILGGNDGKGTVLLKLELYNIEKSGNEIGHTDEHNVIHTYRGFLIENKANFYASHLAHEYCHTLGFTHKKLFGLRKHHSVPYLVGDIVEAISSVR